MAGKARLLRLLSLIHPLRELCRAFLACGSRWTLRRPAAFYGLSAAPIRDSRNQRCLHITFRYQSFTDRAKKLISTPPQATITSLLPLPLQQPGVQLSADSAVSALEATKLILARAESLEASREAVPDDAKKAASLDGF